jgi:dihydrofolate reductase
MKKVILDLAVTLDGYIEGPNGEIDWCIIDDDMDFDSFLSGIDTSGLLAMFHIFSMTACKLQR